MRSAIILVLSIWVFGASSVACRASLGDTLTQCIARYGSPISQGKGDSTNGGYGWYDFRKGVFEIEESFDQGIVIIEVVWKTDRLAMSESEQETVLKANTGTGKWGQPKDGDRVRFWVRNDGAYAGYYPLTGNETLGNEMSLGLGPARRH